MIRCARMPASGRSSLDSACPKSQPSLGSHVVRRNYVRQTSRAFSSSWVHAAPLRRLSLDQSHSRNFRDGWQAGVAHSHGLRRSRSRSCAAFGRSPPPLTHLLGLFYPRGEHSADARLQGFPDTTSCQICRSPLGSATNRFSLPFSSRSYRSSRNSLRLSPPYCLRHAQNVVWLMAICRQTSATLAPDSSCGNAVMICSSLAAFVGTA